MVCSQEALRGWQGLSWETVLRLGPAYGATRRAWMEKVRSNTKHRGSPGLLWTLSLSQNPAERWRSGSGAPTASHVLTLLFPGRLFQHALPPSLSQLSSRFSKVAHKMGREAKGAPGHKDRKAFASPVISGTVKTGGIGWILLGLWGSTRVVTLGWRWRRIQIGFFIRKVVSALPSISPFFSLSPLLFLRKNVHQKALTLKRHFCGHKVSGPL